MSSGKGRLAGRLLAAAAALCLSVLCGASDSARSQAACGKISACPPAAALSGAEQAVVVQGGQDRRTTTRDIANLGNPSPVFNVVTYGAVCDGVADATAGINAALSAAAVNGGGTVFIPATGHPCLLNSGITLPSNVTLSGSSLHHWFGSNVSDPQQWAAAGSWLQCADLANPCVTVSGVGNLIADLNFIYAQPVPAGTWTPTTYPYTIVMNGAANFWGVRDVSITAATHCIDIEGPASGIAGINSFMENIYLNGCFNVGTRFSRVDNEIRVSNLNYWPWWYINQSAVEAYIALNKVDWDAQYLANIQGNNIIFGRSFRSIQLRNGTVSSGFGNVTFAGNAWQLTNVSFNEVCQAVSIPGGNGTVTSGVSIVNAIVYGNTTNNCPANSPIMFDLSSDLASWSLDHVQGGYVDTLAAIGHGAAGGLKLNDVDVAKYSAFTAGRTAFMVSANTSFVMSGGEMRAIRANAGAGAVIGPGVDGSQGYLAPVQGGGGGVEGYALLEGSKSATFGGDVAFYQAGGARTGYCGRSSAALEVNCVADSGDWDITAATGHIIALFSPAKHQPFTVAGLPACSLANDGTQVLVYDLTAPAYGAAPVGGGTLRGQVTCTNGTGWLLQ